MFALLRYICHILYSIKNYIKNYFGSIACYNGCKLKRCFCCFSCYKSKKLKYCLECTDCYNC